MDLHPVDLPSGDPPSYPDWPACSFCGAPSQPTGSCFTCSNCGETTGCG
jgi:hypothetical protein